MKYSLFQHKAVKEALINNPVFENLKMWVEDGQLTEEELTTLATHLLLSIPEETQNGN